MSTEKIISEAQQQFLNAAKSAGVSSERLDKMIIDPITTNSLPKAGTFTGYEFKGDGVFTHPRMLTNTGDSISFSAIKLIAHRGTKDTAIFKQASPTSKISGALVLSGKAVNPTLLRSDAALSEYLTGKTFKASPVDVVVLPVRSGVDGKMVPFMPDEETVAREALNIKTVYEITLD